MSRRQSGASQFQIFTVGECVTASIYAGYPASSARIRRRSRGGTQTTTGRLDFAGPAPSGYPGGTPRHQPDYGVDKNEGEPIISLRLLAVGHQTCCSASYVRFWYSFKIGLGLISRSHCNLLCIPNSTPVLTVPLLTVPPDSTSTSGKSA